MKNKKIVTTLIISIVVLSLCLALCAVLIIRNAAKSPTEKAAVETPTPTEAVDQSAEADVKAQAEATQTDDDVFADQNDTIYTTEEVNLREEPTTDGALIITVEKGTMFTRTGVSKDWSRLDFNGRLCYISNQFISTEQPEMSAATRETNIDTDINSPGTADTATGQIGSKGKIVIIDPGHQAQGDSSQEPIGPGASDTKPRVSSGTTGCVSGWAEYELNLAVSLKLRDELVARGYTVYMTRETHDVSISNKERAEFASAHNGDILVRIHANGSDNGSVNGALTMAPSPSNPFLSQELITKSTQLSQCVIDSYIAATGFNNQGVYVTDEMSGINWSKMPVTIVEMGYMTNASDDAAMKDATVQTKMVSGIASGIDQYFAAGN